MGWAEDNKKYMLDLASFALSYGYTISEVRQTPIEWLRALDIVQQQRIKEQQNEQ